VDLLAGDLVGLCHRPEERLYAAADARIGRTRAAIADVEPTTQATYGPYGPVEGFGQSVESQASRHAALAEALERYSLFDIKDDDLQVASAAELRDLGRTHLAPAEFCGHSDAQHARVVATAPCPAADGERIGWLVGRDLMSGEPTLVPAGFVAFGHRNERTGEWTVLGYGTSTNGTAVATTPVDAALAAVMELIERDAFMMMWYHRLRFPTRSVDPASEAGRRIARVVRPARLSYRLLDLSAVHGVPVIVAVLWGRVGDRMIYGVGGAAGFNYDVAAFKAVSEAASVYNRCRRVVERDAVPSLDPADVQDFPDHLNYYLQPDRQRALDFLLDAAPEPSLAPPPEPEPRPAADRLLELAVRLRREGARLVAVDVTPIEGYQVGLYAFRVVSPDLLALDVDHEYRELRKPRLRELPVRRGWRPDPHDTAGLNDDPHPFP
jgi:ribosomal protein S12 methylthiotransferase accessory factor